MLYLSQLMISNPDLPSFDDLLEVVKEQARQGERFLHFDVKPTYHDTPEDWQERIEATFSSRL